MPSFEDRISAAVRRAMHPYVAGRLLEEEEYVGITATNRDVLLAVFIFPFEVSLPCGQTRKWHTPESLPDLSVRCFCGKLGRHWFIRYAEEENLGLLHGLEVKERTSWGLSDTVVLRGPASVDEDGKPTGPDELEIKISSPTRMGLGEWFKDEELYTLEFGPQEEPIQRQLNSPIVIPAMTVVERTLWGLSMTCRLRVDAGKGKNIEVKLSLPWPEDRFLKEGQLYSVIFEPVKGEKPEGEDAAPEDVEPGEDEQPYWQEKLTSQHLDEDLARIESEVADFTGLKAALTRPFPAIEALSTEHLRTIAGLIMEDADANDN